MDFEMVENINLKKLVQALGSDDNLEMNSKLEKKFKKVCNKNLFKKETTNLNKDEHLSLFSSLSKINFVKLDALLDNFNFDILKITKDIMISEDSFYDSEKNLENVLDENLSKINPLDAYLKTMLDIFAFKYIFSKLRNMTNTIKEQIEHYIELVQSGKENYSQYSSVLMEKIKKIFGLDDLLKFKKFSKLPFARRTSDDNVYNSIEYMEQSPFSVQQLWLADENQVNEEELKKEKFNFTKSTTTNSRRCSIRNNCCIPVGSKSSKHLNKLVDLMDFKEDNKTNNLKENLVENNLPTKERKNIVDDFTTLQKRFLSNTLAKQKNKNSKKTQFIDDSFIHKFDNFSGNKNSHTQKQSLGTIAELSKCHLINTTQRSQLKELVLDNNQALIKILNIYESDRNLDSLYNNIIRLLDNIK